MKQVLSIAVLVILGLLAILYAVEFLVSKSETMSLKSRLVDWYVFVADGDWTSLVAYSGRATGRLLDYLIGPRLFSWKFWIVLLIVGTIYTISLLDVRGDLRAGLPPWTAADIATVAAFLGLNATIDMMSVGITRRLVNRIGVTPSRQGMTRFLILAVLVGYTTIAVSIVAFLLFEFARDSVEVRNLTNVFEWAAFWPFYIFTSSSNGGIRWFYFLVELPACFTTLILIVFLTGSWFISVSKPLTQKPISILLDRLDTAPAGLIGTLIKALQWICGALVTARGLLG